MELEKKKSKLFVPLRQRSKNPSGRSGSIRQSNRDGEGVEDTITGT